MSFPFSSFPAYRGAGVGTPRPAGLPWLLRAGPSATLDEKCDTSTGSVTCCQYKRKKFFIIPTKVCGNQSAIAKDCAVRSIRLISRHQSSAEASQAGFPLPSFEVQSGVFSRLPHRVRAHTDVPAGALGIPAWVSPLSTRPPAGQTSGSCHGTGSPGGPPTASPAQTDPASDSLGLNISPQRAQSPQRATRPHQIQNR